MRVVSDAVSVIVPSWNCGRFLPACLDSLLAQTHPPEIIVVDDGSTDGTAEVLARYGGSVRCIRHPRRRGANAARNTGMRSASGDWIIFADADAVYRPQWIAQLLEAARGNERVGIVYSGFTRRFDDGREHFFPSRDWDPAALWWENYIAMPSLVRRDAPGVHGTSLDNGLWTLCSEAKPR